MLILVVLTVVVLTMSIIAVVIISTVTVRMERSQVATAWIVMTAMMTTIPM